jgi:periplasmic protein TonB
MSNHALVLPELDQRVQRKELRLLQENIDESAWKTIAGNIRALLFPSKLPPLVLTSKPIAVVDPMAEKRGRASSIISIVLHVAMISAILWAFLAVKKVVPMPTQRVTRIDIPAYMPIAPPKGPAMGGGGGGGSHDIIQTPKGRLPQVQAQPVAAPMVIENNHPKMTAAPAINMPKEIQVASNLPNLGDPKTSVVGAPSNGIGSAGGMGIGSGGGIGSGKSNGFGSGSGGGYGGGLYHVGGAVSAPQLVSAPDPEFTDEARRVNYGGVCVVSLIVDAQGNTQRIQVVKHLGMGLDEKAVEAVRRYHFKPAILGGKAVPVEMDVEVTFHIS